MPKSPATVLKTCSSRSMVSLELTLSASPKADRSCSIRARCLLMGPASIRSYRRQNAWRGRGKEAGMSDWQEGRYGEEEGMERRRDTQRHRGMCVTQTVVSKSEGISGRGSIERPHCRNNPAMPIRSPPLASLRSDFPLVLLASLLPLLPPCSWSTHRCIRRKFSARACERSSKFNRVCCSWFLWKASASVS